MSDPRLDHIHRNDSVVVISTFIVDPANQTELARVLSDASDRVLRKQRGFLASAVYSSLDGTRVVNSAHWSSSEAVDAMLQNPECRAHLPWVHTVATIEPARYVTTSVHTAPDQRRVTRVP